MNLTEQNFGVEIEMTGLTCQQAADAVAEYFHTDSDYCGGGYDEFHVNDPSGRIWKIVYDSSITAQRKVGGRKQIADSEYKVELVTPICQYQDIESIQEIVRKLRENKAFVNASCGIHIHVNATPFTAKQLTNLVNIVASKEDLVYKALQVDDRRANHYCRRIDPTFLKELNQKKPKTREALKSLWYGGGDRSHRHYDDTRYHCLNYHSVFQKNTIEFRAFNAVLHAGKIKAYIQFCLGMTAQAYNQQYAKQTKTQTSNDKYTFRVWLLRLGMIGDEFKTARTHLLGHLDGNIAWKTQEQAEAQKQRLRTLKEKGQQENTEDMEELEQEQQSGMTMSMGM